MGDGCAAQYLKVIWAKSRRNVAVISKIGGLVANLASKVGNFLYFILIEDKTKYHAKISIALKNYKSKSI